MVCSEWTDGQFIHMYIHADTTTTTATTTRTPTTTTKLPRPWRLSPAAAARCYGRKTFTLRPTVTSTALPTQVLSRHTRSTRSFATDALGLGPRAAASNLPDHPDRRAKLRTSLLPRPNLHAEQLAPEQEPKLCVNILVFSIPCGLHVYVSELFLCCICLGFVVENTTPAATEKFHIESRSSTSKT